ncbi:MAG: hypothetical protein K6C37_03235 [Bacteroidales bacterium]|nr:hypothetical protein [Bacteroidales bacterium]
MNKLSFQGESLLEKSALEKKELAHMNGGGACPGNWWCGGGMMGSITYGYKVQKGEIKQDKAQR